MCLSKCKLSTKEGHIVPLPKNMSPSKQQTYMYEHHNTDSNITIQCT